MGKRQVEAAPVPDKCRALPCRGSVTNDGEVVAEYAGPLTYYIADSSDTGAAAGPLYVTKRPIDDSNYEFGFAEVGLEYKSRFFENESQAPVREACWCAV